LPAILTVGARPTAAGRGVAGDGADALAGGVDPAEEPELPELAELAEQEASRTTDATAARKTGSRGAIAPTRSLPAKTRFLSRIVGGGNIILASTVGARSSWTPTGQRRSV
jgi:hypothetical protein